MSPLTLPHPPSPGGPKPAAETLIPALSWVHAQVGRRALVHPSLDGTLCGVEGEERERVPFQAFGLSLRKRRGTGYTEQLQQYSSPGEGSGEVGVQR